MLRGELSNDVPVASLFGVSLDDHAKVVARVDELSAQVQDSTQLIAGLEERLAAIAAAQAADAAPPIASAVEALAHQPPPAVTRPATMPFEQTQPTEALPAQTPAAEARSELPPSTDTANTQRDALAAEEGARQRIEAEQAHTEAAKLLESERVARATLTRERADIEARLPAARLRLDVATKRLAYLQRLALRLERVTDASRRILPSLAAPREALRSHAADLADVASAVGALASRLDELASRCEAGMLVGFVSERRGLADGLSAAAGSYRQHTARLEAMAGDLVGLAEQLEAEGREVRATFFRSVALESESAFDELFLEHLRAQRRLRRGVNANATAFGRGDLTRARQDADAILPDPRRIGTTGDAREILEAGLEHRLTVEGLLVAESEGGLARELAFENELVTLLSEQASKAARASAYDFSRELVDDITGEVALAWERTQSGIEGLRAELPTARALATTPTGQNILQRIAGVTAALVAWLVVRRRTPKITILLVKSLARLPALRTSLGQIVRWSGLVQTVLPALLALAILWMVLQLIGPATPIAQVLRVTLLPLLLYVLGRQFLIGATRRITRARPALIELRPETLARLQRTYASLGIVVAIAYMLDGLARVAIGAGRLVALIDAVVVVWVGMWALWEAHRWRVALAQSWLALTPQTDPRPVEGRIAEWMEQARLGFVLSPLALVRVLSTPLARALRSHAIGTSAIQALRARMLRRRSMQADSGQPTSNASLPEAYLQAFPLHPVLGVDDALIVTREAVLEEVTAQWKRWQKSKVDGSLVLIGEKGAGKTTLAAQIARRMEGAELVQHTIRGKPTRREQLVTELGAVLGCAETESVSELSSQLCAGPERVVVVDETHNVFLRHVDGYGAYDALVDLVNATSAKVFWLFIFNSFTWRFLNESRGRVHYFRQLLFVPPWTTEEIQLLIQLRNSETGFELRFNEMLLSDRKAASGNLELVEEADDYFRLLWESSGGNPRIASQLWLASLRPISEGLLGVGLFPEPNGEVLSGLTDDVVFALAAICQHENLSAQELARVLNMSNGFARFAVQFLAESGLIEPKDGAGERFTLSAKHYRAAIRALRNKHLLFD